MDDVLNKTFDFFLIIAKNIIILVAIIAKNTLITAGREVKNMFFCRKANNNNKLFFYMFTIILTCILIYYYRLPDFFYFFSLFTMFFLQSIIKMIKESINKRANKITNKRYSKLREMFNNDIYVIKKTKDYILIQSNTVSLHEIDRKKEIIEVFFNRKIESIKRKQNFKYIQISFENDRLKFKSCYFLNEYINYSKIKGNIPFVLGVSKTSQIIIDDMARLNHVFISGESNTGKSVLLNQIIQTLLVFNDHIELFLVDLKEGVEFHCYHKFKNILIISNIKQLENLIDYLEKEMITRLNLIKEIETKNIIEYNKKTTTKMSTKIIVIDEFSTIKLDKQQSGLENKLLQILQKGRAAGIYVIGATQRPAGTQINTDIRAGFLFNISLRVKTKETQKMTKISGTEKLNIGEFKSDIVDFPLKSLYTGFGSDEIFNNLKHVIAEEKEFIFIKDKEQKKDKLYKRLCMFMYSNLVKRRTTQRIENVQRINYIHMIKKPTAGVIAEIEKIKQELNITNNSINNGIITGNDDYSIFLNYLFVNSKDNILPPNNRIENDLKLTRSKRLKLLKQAIKDNYIDDTIKNKPKLKKKEDLNND